MASQAPFPLMPPKSTELRLLHFDDYAYTGTSDTLLYKYMDALAGTTGAGALVNEIFLARMAGAMQTIYFNELDFIFGKISFLARSPAESYTFNPSVDVLTSDQWDEVRIKDAWYRARIIYYFKACSLGGTPDGIRQCVQAAVAADCDIFEVWRYRDNFGLTSDLGRSPTPLMYAAVNMATGYRSLFSSQAAANTFIAGESNPSRWTVHKQQERNEVVIKPHKASLQPQEMRLLRDMLEKMCPLDAVITVNLSGLAVITPVLVGAAAADSTYYEVQKMVTATPALDQLPAPELLPIDLLPTETWLYDAKNDPTLAPYAAFNISAEFGYYYLVGGGNRSPIDSVTYGTLQADGSVRTESNFQVYDTTGSYAAKVPYDKADSPDNYPGGKFGIHPDEAPAKNPDGSNYTFHFDSQNAYITQKTLEVLALGGIADADGYRLPVSAPSSAATVFYPNYAISYFPPSKDSDVTMSLTRRRGRAQSTVLTSESRDPVNFVRNT